VRPLHDPTQALVIDVEFDLNHLKKLVGVLFCNSLETGGEPECY